MASLRHKTRYVWALIVLALGLTIASVSPTFSFDDNSASVQPQVIQADDCGKPTCP